MRHAGVRAVPVVDGNEVIDIFTFTDALRTCSNP